MNKSDFKQLPVEQRQATYRLWRRALLNDHPSQHSFSEFVGLVIPEVCGDAILVDVGNLWHGIETDGYTHT
jgi:hypothetical protein